MNFIIKGIGFILSLTVGQAIVIVTIIYFTYWAGRIGLFG